MNRVKDYVQFAVWFVGLGYMALWPLTAHDHGIAAQGALSAWPMSVASPRFP